MSNQFQKKYPKEVARFVIAGRKMGQSFTQITERAQERWPKIEFTRPGIQGLYYRKTKFHENPPEEPEAPPENEAGIEANEQEVQDLIAHLKSKGYAPIFISKAIEKRFGLKIAPKDINKSVATKKEELRQHVAPKKLQVHLNWEEEDSEYIEVRVRILVSQATSLLVSLLQGDL
jgi:hypothetical protein